MSAPSLAGCAVCFLDLDFDRVPCPRCRAEYHRDCLASIGCVGSGCGTRGGTPTRAASGPRSAVTGQTAQAGGATGAAISPVPWEARLSPGPLSGSIELQGQWFRTDPAFARSSTGVLFLCLWNWIGFIPGLGLTVLAMIARASARVSWCYDAGGKAFFFGEDRSGFMIQRDEVLRLQVDHIPWGVACHLTSLVIWTKDGRRFEIGNARSDNLPALLRLGRLARELAERSGIRLGSDMELHGTNGPWRGELIRAQIAPRYTDLRWSACIAASIPVLTLFSSYPSLTTEVGGILVICLIILGLPLLGHILAWFDLPEPAEPWPEQAVSHVKDLFHGSPPSIRDDVIRIATGAALILGLGGLRTNDGLTPALLILLSLPLGFMMDIAFRRLRAGARMRSGSRVEAAGADRFREEVRNRLKNWAQWRLRLEGEPSSIGLLIRGAILAGVLYWVLGDLPPISAVMLGLLGATSACVVIVPLGWTRENHIRSLWPHHDHLEELSRELS